MQFRKRYREQIIPLLLLIPAVFLAACNSEEPAPTAVAEVTVPTEIAAPSVPATWTPIPAVVLVTMTTAPTEPPPPTSTPLPTATEPPATDTPEAPPTETPTETPPPTNTPVPVTAAPTRPPVPAGPAPAQLPAGAVLGDNLLPNPSFEEGHYNQNGIAELQLPNGWRLDYQEGATGFGGQAWDVYVRPEVRVLSTAFLPPEEHGLYIFDGANTVKIFKGTGAVSTRLLTDVDLQPGTYVLEANFFSDVFESFENKQKNPPGDPSAGEAALFVGNTGTGWVPNQYLNKNRLQYTFTVGEPQRLAVGVGFRGRYAIANNGWFVDNLSLRRVQ